MTYLLHYAPDNASLIVRLALEHLGCPYHTSLVDRRSAAQRGTAYLALNPVGLIPTLETPQGPLFETGAILLWLGDTHGGLGPGPQSPARAAYLKWLFYVSNTLHPLLRMMFYPQNFVGPDSACHARLRSGVQEQVQTALGHLDRLAASAPDWFGHVHGALDFYVACCLRWCALYPAGVSRDWFDLSQTPALRAICAALEAREITAAVQAAEGLGPTPFTSPRYPDPPEGSAL
ncbi:glutathione S-transferase family protein [Sulfitobacter sp. HNIBRBA3233]|uniref:glutathione S-transferase family protein n=1 Tax=Sulfitobacter marinivivus TaxID=3158558 RepID=UPI0032DF8BB1